MKQRSAGLLLYRRRGETVEFFLVHPGGPFWAKKDDGAWSIPKGLIGENEAPLAAAKREFEEETGFRVDGDFVALGEFKQPSGKLVAAWSLDADCDPSAVKSNLFAIEWPPRSGRIMEFPEVDRAAWWNQREAFTKILRGQRPILERLCEQLGVKVSPVSSAGPRS